MKATSAHAALPAADIHRARRFYSETLGFGAAREDPAGTFYQVGESEFLVFPSGGRPSGEHTQMGITVDDIEETVAELKGRGVTFEEYDLPHLKTVDGIATTGAVRSAWFKDSEGNLVVVLQFG